jgi:cytoskeletal protein RodZ
MPEIGATLREARMRERIDVSEIEAQTKIRAKYLRALENEEWGLLPGPTFVKSFLRTYAQALGLDGKALVEEYRLHHEGDGDQFEPIVATPGRTPRGRTPRAPSGASRRYTVAVAVAGAVVVLLIVLLATSGGSSNTNTTSTSAKTAKHTSGSHRTGTSTPVAVSSIVALSLKPTAVVYVCLEGDHGRRLVPGVELQPGESTPTFHAHHFLLTLGNNSVTMYIDGRPRTVAPSSEAIGYSITKAHGRQPLTSAQMPTCR